MRPLLATVSLLRWYAHQEIVLIAYRYAHVKKADDTIAPLLIFPPRASTGMKLYQTVSFANARRRLSL
jgi:hypothetical protein